MHVNIWSAIESVSWSAPISHPMITHEPINSWTKKKEMLNFLATQGQMLEEKFRPYLDLSKAGLKSYWPW